MKLSSSRLSPQASGRQKSILHWRVPQQQAAAWPELVLLNGDG
jgi:hypothetical protein